MVWQNTESPDKTTRTCRSSLIWIYSFVRRVQFGQTSLSEKLGTIKVHVDSQDSGSYFLTHILVG